MFNIFKKHPLVAATLQGKTTNELKPFGVLANRVI